jgi:GxxExxY protein
MTQNELSSIVIGCAIEVHSNLGPGLLESVYEACLFYELKQIGLNVKQQEPLPVFYKGIEIPVGLKLDLLIENKLIVEVKSVKELQDIHTAQLITYLKISNIELGLLLNFNETRVKNGIKRIVNNFRD